MATSRVDRKRADRGAFVLRVPRTLAFLLMTLALVLVVGEVIQRISDWRKYGAQVENIVKYAIPRTALVMADGTVLSTDHATMGAQMLDPYRMYRSKPNQVMSGSIHVNAQGFRGRDWTREKPAGTLRVAVLGASLVFGYGVRDDEKLFTIELERRLQALLPSAALPGVTTIEVLNAGVSGYGAMQEMLTLVTQVMDFAPDLVVVIDGWNDFFCAVNSPPDLELCNPQYYELNTMLARTESLPRMLLRHSAMFRSFLGTYDDWRASRTRVKGEFGAYFAPHPKALPEYRRALEVLCRAARGAGEKVVLVTQPEMATRAGTIPASEQQLRDAKGPDYDRVAHAHYPAFAHAARDVAAAEGALYDDATVAFDHDDAPVYTDWVHMNEHGYALLVDHLTPVLARALGLSAPGPADAAPDGTPLDNPGQPR